MDRNVKNSLVLLGEVTHGRFSIRAIAGDRHGNARQSVMSALKGHKVPKAQCGVNALREALYGALKINPQATLAAQEDAFIEAAKRMVK